MNITVNTELGAVNRILFSIGASPVNSLSETSVDVVGARTQLSYASARVQSRGWTFNIQENLFVPSDAFSKQIIWRPNWLRVTTSGGQTPYMNKGGLLYDRVSRTNLFPSGVTVDIVEEQPFDELPFCFQAYIAAKAAKAFNAGAFGDPGTAAEIEQEIAEAWFMCQEYELDSGDYGIFEDTYVQGRLARR